MASGHANRTQAEHMAAPTQACDVRKVLANPEPSTHGTMAKTPTRGGKLLWAPRCAHFSRNHAPEIAALFIAPARSLRFAVLSHTGPIGIVPVGVVEVAAVLKGGRACRADVAA